LTRERLLVVKVGSLVTITLGSAALLYLRGTPDALLTTNTFAGAIFAVVFWALPAFVLYLLVPWSMSSIVIEGLLLAAIFLSTWWHSATDSHSTASVGPGFAGWILGPVVILAGVALTAAARRFPRSEDGIAKR